MKRLLLFLSALFTLLSVLGVILSLKKLSNNIDRGMKDFSSDEEEIKL